MECMGWTKNGEEKGATLLKIYSWTVNSEQRNRPEKSISGGRLFSDFSSPWFFFMLKYALVLAAHYYEIVYLFLCLPPAVNLEPACFTGRSEHSFLLGLTRRPARAAETHWLGVPPDSSGAGVSSFRIWPANFQSLLLIITLANLK